MPTQIGVTMLPEPVVRQGTTAHLDAPAETRCTLLASGEEVTIVDGHAILPEGLLAVPADAFRGDDSIVAVTLPVGVMKIGRNAFEGCASLEDVVMPESVTRICEHAFDGCIALTDAPIAPSVTVIGDSAFRGCISLTTLLVPPLVREIGWHAFDGCASLMDVYIPPSVTQIGGFAFLGCALTTVSIACETQIAPQSFDGHTRIRREPIARWHHEVTQFLPKFEGALGFRPYARQVCLPACARFRMRRSHENRSCFGATSFE